MSELQDNIFGTKKLRVCVSVIDSRRKMHFMEIMMEQMNMSLTVFKNRYKVI